MFNRKPARVNNSWVVSWRLPFGSPSDTVTVQDLQLMVVLFTGGAPSDEQLARADVYPSVLTDDLADPPVHRRVGDAELTVEEGAGGDPQIVRSDGLSG